MAVQGQIFQETGPFLVPYHFVTAKVIFMAHHTQSMQSIQLKTFFIWKNLLLSNKDKQKRATFAVILDARIFFHSCRWEILSPKTPIFSQKWPEIHFFLKNG